MGWISRLDGPRASLRGWLGFVEAVALDWLDHRDLSVRALVELVLRPIATLIELA